MADTIYLDHAAATPVDPAVVTAMLPYFEQQFYNPSATYMAAVSVRKDLEAARAVCAQTIGARPSEIIFTAGATEANNLVIRGVMEQFPDSHMIVSAIEHESVLATAHRYNVSEAPVQANGIIDVAHLTELITDSTILVSIMFANNEIGTVQPLRDISQTLNKVRTERRKAGNTLPLYLHTDAAQAGNYLDMHVARLGVDFMTVNGGKVYGPKQTGFLFAAAQTRFVPQVSGGGQERGQRSGTENVAGSIGLSVALQRAQAQRQDETIRLRELQKLFIELLTAELPQITVNGSQKLRLPNNVHVTITGHDNERLLIGLDNAGILAAAGSACSASNEEPSHVLRAIGLSDADAQASLRFTMGRETTEAMIRTTATTLKQLVAQS